MTEHPAAEHPSPVTPQTEAGRSLLDDLVEHVESLAPSEADAMWHATTTAILAIEREAADAARKEVPPGTRLILASEGLLDQWGTRTEDGYRIRAEWGEQKPEGWYEPTFTIDYTDSLARPVEEERK